MKRYNVVVVDFVVDLVVDVISWINPIPEIPDFGGNQPDINARGVLVNKISANALLARVGALHHDIGKIKNPSYFSENQLSGQNLHDQISSKQSVEIIKSHVTNGVKLAKNYGLDVAMLNKGKIIEESK